jgi:hypothetical protein
MHPDLEDFLEAAFQSVQPTSANVGRVVVEPDYEAAPSEQDGSRLASELVEVLQSQTENAAQVRSRQGQEIQIPGKYELLSRYVRRIVLHAERVEGSWIEVAPPGSWI